MSDKNFDQHLKSVLDDLEPMYDPSTWATLEQRLNAPILEEQPASVDAVDKAVFHTLNRMEAPYQSGHWNLMSQRLESLQLRLRHLRIAKIAELCLLLLFLWNFPTFFGKNGSEQFHPNKPVFDPNVPVAQAGPSHTPGTTGTAFSKQSAAYQSAMQAVVSLPETPDLLSSDYILALSVPSELKKLDDLKIKASHQIFAAADLLPFDALAALMIPERAVLLPVIPVQKMNTPGPFYLSANGSFNHDRVLVNGQRRTSPGYGGAIAAGYRTGKWGFEVGAGYARKVFTPKKEVEIYAGNIASGYVGSTLTEVHTDIIAVPLKVTRRIAQVGKTTAHAVAGVTANFAAQKTYDYGTVYYTPDLLPPNFLPDPNQSPTLRKSGQGILEKGRLDDNFYASVDLGIRIEHPIAGGRYTAFVEPSLRQSITGKGIGPKREPINSMTIQAGVLAFL